MTSRILTPMLSQQDVTRNSLADRLNRCGRTRLLLGVIIALVVVHAGFVILALIPRSPLAGFSGSESYSTIAQNMIQSGKYSLDGQHPTAYRPPLYPALLALNMRLFGDLWRVGALATQGALGIVCGLLIFLIATDIFKNQVAGLIAVVLYLTDLLFQLEAVSKRETIIYTAFLLTFFYSLVSFRTTFGNCIVLALLAAMAYLTRPVGIVLMILLPLFVIGECRKLRTAAVLTRLGICIAVMAVVIAPWQFYVYKTFHTHTFWPTSTSGINAFQGNNPATEIIYPYIDVDNYLPWINKKLVHAGIDPSDELVADRFLRDGASQFMREHPGRFLKSAAIKAFALFSPVPIPLGKGKIIEADDSIALIDFHYATGLGTVLFTLHGLIMIIGAILYFFRKPARTKQSDPAEVSQQRRAVFYIVLFLALVTAMHVLTFAETRFRLPLDMFLILFAALAYSPRNTARPTVAAHG